MHKLHDLKDMLVRDLCEYAERSQLDRNDIAEVDTLAHATKNLCKIIRDLDDGYSGDSPDGTVYRGYTGRRDSMGRYSRSGSLADEIRAMMDNIPDDRTRQALQRLANRADQM